MIGKLIAFEGLDGSGKTSQSLMLKNYLNKNNIPCSIFSLYKEDIVERMLANLDDIDMIDNIGSRYAVFAKLLCRQEWEIEKRLSQGEHIILDKYIYTFSTTELVRGADRKELNTMSLELKPADITFVLGADPVAALSRKSKIGYREAGLDQYEYYGEKITFKRFKEGYYPEDWIRNRYLQFQNSLLETLNSLLEEHRSNRSIVCIKNNQSIEVVHQIIIDSLLSTQVE